ncbi:diguanylate cyclase [Arcobacter roscoffensis]|uniref:diguanylate cyclase n=1 Tax=Arcobacter roscoffensis TaxID=2961520 RepID=A0ABY5DZX6_9BACT|nr:diguanylate cyclase [Arcobacter roscoffensis]UTJ05509.1 diguanylate cyclase [Arcobacter roscoffensis]
MKSIFFKLTIILLLINTLFANSRIRENNENVILQLQWKNQFQFAGYYIAKEKGFYKDYKINVTIKQREYGQNVVNEVLNKKAHFATGRSSLIIDRVDGKKVVLLASIFQSSPDILIALKNSNIKNLQDLKNKRVMITGNAKNDIVLKSMLFSKKIQDKDIIVQKHTFDLADLVYGNTDVMASYISNEPFILKNKYHLESKIFDPKDYGFDFYSDILFTHEDFVKKNPMLVKKFKQASLKGWEYAFENINETVNIIYEKYNTQNKSKKALLYEAKELKKLAFYNTKKLGEIKKEKVEKIYNFYKLMGEVNKEIDYDKFIFKSNALQLNSTQLQYLENKKRLKLCIDPNWLPFEKFDKNKKHVGLTKDYYDMFSKKLKIDIKPVYTNSWNQTLEFIKEKKCDILSLAMQTKKREEYLNFTSSYVTVPLVLATKINIPFVDNLMQIKNKKVGIVSGYAFEETLKNHYKDIEFVSIKNIKDGLKKVAEEKIFGVISSIADISFEIRNNYTNELKITAKLDEKLEMAIGLRKDEPILKDIFQKLLDNLNPKFITDIQNKYFSSQVEKYKDYTLFWQTTIFFLFIITIILYWSYKLKIEKTRNEEILKELKATQNELKIKNKRLKFLARVDKLTGVYNRTKLDEVLEKEINRSKRFKRDFSIMLIDIDDFKNINDTYGHLVGDKILIALADLLKIHTRNVDTVGRWGGEEFLIICPETDKLGAVKLAKYLQVKINEFTFEENLKITVSIGLSMFKEDTSDTILKKADIALYDVKENGKNSIEFMDDLPKD